MTLDGWKVKYTKLARIAGVVLVTVILVVLLIALSRTPESPIYEFNVPLLLTGVPVGTKPRVEREYKLAVDFPSDLTTDSDD